MFSVSLKQSQFSLFVDACIEIKSLVIVCNDPYYPINAKDVLPIYSLKTTEPIYVYVGNYKQEEFLRSLLNLYGIPSIELKANINKREKDENCILERT